MIKGRPAVLIPKTRVKLSSYHAATNATALETEQMLSGFRQHKLDDFR